MLKEWKVRYEQQPESVKKELDELKSNLAHGNYKSFQLLKIKKSYIFPEKGDVFVFQPKENIYFYGLVINAHLNNLQGNDLYVVALFKIKSQRIDFASFELDYDTLMIAPLMLSRVYWTKGLFFNVGHIDDLGKIPSYGFYRVAYIHHFWNEYDEPLDERPDYLSVGSATDIGVGYKVNRELIIDKSLLE